MSTRRTMRAITWSWSGPHSDAEGVYGELTLTSGDGTTLWAPMTRAELTELASELETLAWRVGDAEDEAEGESLAEHDRKESERTWRA